VVIAVEPLGDELGQESVRQMAVHALGHGVVAPLDPRIVLGAHDVAVGAGLGIGPEVGQALGVDEGEEPQAEQNPSSDGGEDESLLREGEDHRGFSLAQDAPSVNRTRHQPTALAGKVRTRGLC